MKKIISLLLCVAILCSMVVIVAQADGGATAQFANATTIPGGSVTIDMVLANNPGVIGLRFTITPQDEIGATFAFDGVSVSDGLEMAYPNNAGRIYAWDALTNCTDELVGALTITVPSETPTGSYKFTVVGDDCKNASNEVVPIAGTEFTITVTDKAITGVNVAIDAGLAIGIHVATSDPDDTSITAVDVAGREFVTITEYIEDEENGGYIYYLNVNPWAMDVDFVVDFTENFAIDDQGDEDDANDTLNLTTIPATAKTVGILSYCNKLLGAYDEEDGYSCADELSQLIADMLEFGRQAQIYKNGAATLALPVGLAATEAAWENGDGDPCSFGDYCSENFPKDLTGKNATAKKKFEFDKATIEFGSKFVVTFTFKNGATATASNLARVKANGETYSLDGWNLEYAFSPAEYAGVEFDLYASGTTNATNFAWINNYGPAHYAAYLNDTYPEDETAAAILSVMEAFYNYGVSVEAYVATLGE